MAEREQLPGQIRYIPVASDSQLRWLLLNRFADVPRVMALLHCSRATAYRLVREHMFAYLITPDGRRVRVVECRNGSLPLRRERGNPHLTNSEYQRRNALRRWYPKKSGLPI